MTALAAVLTISRFFIHWRKTGKLRWDDYLNGVAVIFLFAYTTTFYLFATPEVNAELYELGAHAHLPKNLDQHRDAKLNVANMALFWLVLYSVKASFLALYWQIFSTSRRFRIAWALVVSYTFISFSVSFFWVFWRCGHPKLMTSLSKYLTIRNFDRCHYS